MGYLRRKLASRKERCETRYDYYEMKNQMVDISSVIPPEFRWLKECLGWCSKAVAVSYTHLTLPTTSRV